MHSFQEEAFLPLENKKTSTLNFILFASRYFFCSGHQKDQRCQASNVAIHLLVDLPKLVEFTNRLKK